MALFVIRYAYDPALTELRYETRPAHRDWLTGLHAGGVNRVSGPLTDDTGGILVFDVADRAAVDALLTQDPYYAAGVIAETRVDDWTIVFGSLG